MSPMGPAEACIILTSYFERKKKIIQILKSCFASKDQKKITQWQTQMYQVFEPLKTLQCALFLTSLPQLQPAGQGGVDSLSVSDFAPASITLVF